MKPRRPNPSCFDSREDYDEALDDYSRRLAAREQMAEERYDYERENPPDPYDEW